MPTPGRARTVTLSSKRAWSANASVLYGRPRIADLSRETLDYGRERLEVDENGVLPSFTCRVRPLRHPVHAPDGAWLRYNSL